MAHEPRNASLNHEESSIILFYPIRRCTESLCDVREHHDTPNDISRDQAWNPSFSNFLSLFRVRQLLDATTLKRNEVQAPKYSLSNRHSTAPAIMTIGIVI